MQDFIKRHYTALCALIVTIVGILVIFGWYTHNEPLLQLHPSWAPMQFNTAVCFLCCSSTLFLLQAGHVNAMFVTALIGATISLLTVLQYFLGMDLGIDRFFFRDYFITVLTSSPGRMSPVTALCFFFMEASMLVVSRHRKFRYALPIAGMIAILAVIMAALSLFGYATNIQSVYGYSGYSRMAVHTATNFILLTSGLWYWLLKNGVKEFNPVRWFYLPTALFMIASLGYVTHHILREADEAARLRRHAYEVTLKCEETRRLSVLFQRGTRAYVISGNPQDFELFKKAEREFPLALEVLKDLTLDNPTQQQTLSRLAPLSLKLAEYYRELARLFREEGPAASTRFAQNGEGPLILSELDAELEKMEAEEGRLQNERDAKVLQLSRDARIILITGCLFSIAIVLGAGGWLLRSLERSKALSLDLEQGNTQLRHEIASRAEAERKLLQNEERLRLMYESIQDYAILMLDAQGSIASWNSAAQRLKGYEASEIIGRHFSIFYPQDDLLAAKPAQFLEEAISKGRVEEEGWRVRKDGTRFMADVIITSLKDASGKLIGFVKVTRDITERRAAEEKLRENLKEKEVLLKEIHHRVKNNLAVVIGLIGLQQARVKHNKEVHSALQDCCLRIRAMAMVHESMYQSEDLRHLSIERYFSRMGNEIKSVYARHLGNIRMEFDVDPIPLEMSAIIPCALIFNEVVTNSFKYAFPDGKIGSIRLSMKRDGARVKLAISDTGIGLPKDFDISKANSLGLKLVESLSRQLEGTLTISTEHGTSFNVDFPVQNGDAGPAFSQG